MTCECRRARGAPARAPATWNDGVDGALLCDLLFSLHDDQAHGAMQVLAVLLTGYTPASAAASSSCRTARLPCQHLLASVTLRSKIIRCFSST